MRLLVRRQFSVVSARCAPCIRAYSRLNSYVSEVLEDLRHSADIPQPEPTEVLDAVALEVQNLRGCADDQAWLKASQALEKFLTGRELKDTDVPTMLQAVRPLIEERVAEEISVRCCA